jgi:hypothetical protein
MKKSSSWILSGLVASAVACAADDGGGTGDESTGVPTTSASTSMSATSEPTSTSMDTDDDSGSSGTGSSSGSGSDSGSASESSGSSESGSSSESGEAVCEGHEPDEDTVALWRFDDGDGQVVVDASGNGRDLQLGASEAVDTTDPAWAQGRFVDGGGLFFTGADEDYATRNSGGNTFDDNALTVEFWAFTTSDEHAQVFTAGFINCFVALESNGAGVEFGIGDGNDWEFLSATMDAGSLNDGAWHYIAATYDGAMMRVYVDAEEIGSVAATTDLADPDDYKVGGRPANTFLDGGMDDVRLSDVARTPEEIAAAYAGCG